VARCGFGWRRHLHAEHVLTSGIATATDVAPGDLNSDGIVDVVTSNYDNIDDEERALVYLGTGSGGFLPPQQHLPVDRAYSVGAADFKAEGRQAQVLRDGDRRRRESRRLAGGLEVQGRVS
jgi:hypothetical protein